MAMPTTLLCIDDSQEVQFLINKTFAQSARVIIAETLRDGLDEIKKNKIDVILLDLNLPDGDGFKLLNQLTEDPNYSEIPVIVLTSKDQIQDKAMAFHLGAEDYIVKPFDPIELKIRVDSKVKRHLLSKEQESLILAGNLTINHLEQSVKIKNESEVIAIELTTTEFKILSYLARHKGQVVSREQLINATWKYGFNISDRSVDSHISRIRKKLMKSNCSIGAIQNVGYKFSEISA